MKKNVNSLFEKGVLNIEINRPEKRNSMTYHEFLELTKLIENGNSDPNVKVIYISSIGDVFSAGIDFTTFIEFPFNIVIEQIKSLINALIECSKLIVIGVTGKGIGIGLTMLMLADCVFCSENSTFSTPFLKVGLYPEGCSSVLFQQRLGRSVATNLLFADGQLTAREAKSFGVVLDIYKNEEVHKKAKEYAYKLATNSGKRLLEFKSIIRRSEINYLKEVNTFEMEQILKNSENCSEFQETLKRYKKPKF